MLLQGAPVLWCKRGQGFRPAPHSIAPKGGSAHLRYFSFIWPHVVFWTPTWHVGSIGLHVIPVAVHVLPFGSQVMTFGSHVG